ncbi:MAG TPA: site-2 protease family protein [Thermoanaerobaculia bacterium]|nr:site-2 protease family protein [Thermoanaerobaculia bacterium]
MDFSPDLLPLLAAWFVVFVFSTTLHEAGHALAAYRMGDPTAYHGGQVSLNPVPHIARAPFGMVLVPILSFVLLGGNWMVGWASAPYDAAWASRYPRKAALMALAGPAANLVVVLLAILAMRIGLATGFFAPKIESFSIVVGSTAATGSTGLATVLSILFSLNVVLLVFNLLPLPPLDGSAVIQLAMSESLARRWQELLANPMWAFVGIVLAWRLIDPVLRPVYGLALQLLYAGA